MPQFTKTSFNKTYHTTNRATQQHIDRERSKHSAKKPFPPALFIRPEPESTAAIAWGVFRKLPGTM
jgi:hypothetical protein